MKFQFLMHRLVFTYGRIEIPRRIPGGFPVDVQLNYQNFGVLIR